MNILQMLPIATRAALMIACSDSSNKMPELWTDARADTLSDRTIKTIMCKAFETSPCLYFYLNTDPIKTIFTVKTDVNNRRLPAIILSTSDQQVGIRLEGTELTKLVRDVLGLPDIHKSTQPDLTLEILTEDASYVVISDTAELFEFLGHVDPMVVPTTELSLQQ